MHLGAGQQFAGRKDYWGDALASLEEKKQGRIKKELLIKEDLTSWPDIIAEICRRERDGRQKKEWKLRLAGREIDLRKMMDGWTEFLDKIKQIGDVTVNVDPIYAGLPWAALRVILTAVIASKEQSTAIYVGIGKILVLMNRGAAYELQLAQLDDELLLVSASFESSLIELYAQLLDFLASALLVQDKNAFERTLLALWTPKDITRFGEYCIELEKKLEIESRLIDRKRNRETSENIKTLLNATKSLEKTATDTRALIEAFRLEEQERDDNARALSWVSELPVLDHHADAKSGRAPGTGQWVFRKPEFVGWDRTSKASFLWIHGIPGAGKTKLVSAVVDHFLSLHEAELESRLDDGTDSEFSEDVPFHPISPAHSKIALAFFYCRRAEAERRKPENIFRSFIKQLAVINDKSLGFLRGKYIEKRRRGFLSNMLDSMETEDLLNKMIKQNSQTILVLDALDECEEDSRHSLMTVLSELVEKGLPVKVLISSRRDDDITAEFEHRDNFNISATDNGEDIMSFVRGKINEYRNSSSRARRRKSSVISDELEQQIINVFLDKSNGMFQWAAMHIAHLLSLNRPSDIAKALPNLPRGLEKTYDEIFERIMRQEEGLRDIALRAFHWMLSQDGTSDLEQLLVAVCQDPDGDEIWPVDLDPDVVLKACQNLVVEEGRYDSTYESRDIRDRDELGYIPRYGPDVNSSDFFTHAFSRIPPPLRPSKSPDSVSLRFRSPSPSPTRYSRYDRHGRHPTSRHGHPPTSRHCHPPGWSPGRDITPPPPTNWPSAPPPPPPPCFPPPPPTNWPGGPPPHGIPSPCTLPPPPPPPGFPPPPSMNWSGGPPPREIRSSSTSPLPPSSPVLRPQSPVLRPLHIPPPTSTPSWARSPPPSLFAGPPCTRRRQLRFSHLSVQEYCERLRWTPEVSHCFTAKICLLFLSHLEIQEQIIPDPSSTISTPDGMLWRRSDLRTLPNLELALTKSMFRSVRDFADSFWIYHVQRSCSQMTACQDNKLIAALTNFLGFPGKTSLGFERWLRRFSTGSHIIWRETTLLPAFWSVNDRRRTAKLNYPLSKLQFHDESRLVTCFFGLDRILLPSVSDILSYWGTELVSWAVEFLSGDACALFFSHMSSTPLLSSILKQLPEELTTNILWRLVNSVKTHRLEHIYKSSFLDYSALCLSLAELIHVLQDSNRGDMYGEIVCSLLYPGFSQSSSFVSNGRLWKLVEKVLARGANLNLPFRAARLAEQWHDMVRLIEYGYNPGTDTLALVLAKSLYTRHYPALDLCHALIDIGADVNANSRDLRFEDWHITPLIAACILGEPALINWLLSARANVNATSMREDCNRIPPSTSSDGQVSGDFQQEKTVSPSRNTELNLIRLHSRSENLVRERIWYSTPLIEACARGHKEIFQALTAAGADVHAVMEPDVGRFGSALVAACAHKNPHLSWLLLDDPTIDITTATWRLLRPRPKFVRSLGSIGVPVYTNPLVTASSSGFYDICRELIERGAEVNAVPLDKTGKRHTEGTALIKASAYSHLAVCELLVKHGADVNIVVPEAAHYPTALFAAAMHGQMAAIKWLLDQGAEINKLLLSRFPAFCPWILRDMGIVSDDKMIPPWFFGDDEDKISLPDFPEEDLADKHGMITVELASRLSSLGILVNQDAIKTESSITSLEPLLGSELGSKPSEEMRESASQQAGSMNQRVIFRFSADVILGKYGDEMRGYSLEIFYLAIFFLILGGTTAGIWKHYTSSKA